MLQNVDIGSTILVDLKVKEIDNPNSIVPVDLYLDIENAVSQSEENSLLTDPDASSSFPDQSLIEQNNVVTES